jgi:hypothetical protein
MKLEIDSKIRDALVEYLGSRPYKEVCSGIAALLALREIREAPAETVLKKDGADQTTTPGS